LHSLSTGAFRLSQHKQPRAKPAPPPIVRKDSGEVVRPCLRKRSATAPAADRCPSPAAMRTPRFVHFGTDLERVRWFLKAQSPRAVCEDAVLDACAASEDERRVPTPPVRAERPPTVRLSAIHRPAPSFAAFEQSPVVVERVVLADPRRCSAALRGSIKVHNLAFEKDVAVRYSLDQWRTAHEVPATFSRMLAAAQSGRPSVDRFEFALPLPPAALALLPATLALCVRYRVAGAEHWDNNDGRNYSFRISLPAAPAIADDDCDVVATLAPASCQPTEEGLRAPRRLTFSDCSSNSTSRDAAELTRFAAPTPADTRRYMAQSAALFGVHPSPCMSPPSPPMHASQPELPLFQDMAWGGIADVLPYMQSPASTPPSLPPAAAEPFLPGAGLPQPAATAPPPRTAAASPRTSSPLRIGSPLRHSVFDTDGAVRTGSPLAWLHSNTASALQC
ncbi:hypothetical protein LPJ61_004850, partial [Coemansia biformis]